jgi:hypothetical protein
MSLDTRSNNLDSADANGVVCPFCANTRSDSVGPCPRCTMEDTPATRRSTSERIGPWFVLQKRNPTAPGLRFSVLIMLARRGHVTQRSIVRGPTTQQFWRLASEVKGLSRVFGICWSCQGSVGQEAGKCVACGKPQDPPSDADTFIENLDASVAPIPVMREVPSIDPPTEKLPEPSPKIDLPPKAIRTDKPPTRSASEAIMSARELAAVFQLEKSNRSTGRSLFGVVWRVTKVVLLAGTLLAGAAAATLYIKPDWRGRLWQLVEPYWQQINSKFNLVPDDAPTVELKTPRSDIADPTKREPKKSASTKSEPEQSSVRIAPASRPIDLIRIDKPEPLPPVMPKAEPKAEPTSEAKLVEPVAATREALTIDQARGRAVELRGQALDAEASRDFARAAGLYEQIMLLPEEVRPSDTQTRLRLAKSRMTR